MMEIPIISSIYVDLTTFVMSIESSYGKFYRLFPMTLLTMAFGLPKVSI